MTPVRIIFTLALAVLWPAGIEAEDRIGAADQPRLVLRHDGTPRHLPTFLPFGGQSVTVSLRNVSLTDMMPPYRLNSLMPDPDVPRAKGMQASSILMGGMLTAETEVWQREQHVFEPQHVDGQRGQMTRLGLAGTQGPFRYGASYRSSDRDYVYQPNQKVREVWGEWGHGALRVRSTFGEAWHNAERGATRPTAVRSYERVGLSVNRPFLPEFTLTYVRSSLTNALHRGSLLPRLRTDTFEGVLAYAASTWQARFASSYSATTSDTPGAAHTKGLAESLSAVYRPSDAVTLAPAVGYRADYQQSSGVRIDQPSASLMLNYRATQRLLVSALGGYGVARSSDHLLDSETVNGRGFLTWTFPSSPSSITTTMLGFEAAYQRTANRAQSPTDFEDISGLLRLIVRAF